MVQQLWMQQSWNLLVSNVGAACLPAGRQWMDALLLIGFFSGVSFSHTSFLFPFEFTRFKILYVNWK